MAYQPPPERPGPWDTDRFPRSPVEEDLQQALWHNDFRLRDLDTHDLVRLMRAQKSAYKLLFQEFNLQ